MNDQANQASTAMREMPRYKCHKEVWALKLVGVYQRPANQERTNPGGDWVLVPDDISYSPFIVSHAYYDKHKPQAGGYFVLYDDGYQSYSPAKAFEEGYSRLRDETVSVPLSVLTEADSLADLAGTPRPER